MCTCCRKAQQNLCFATLKDKHSDSLKNFEYNGALLSIQKEKKKP